MSRDINPATIQSIRDRLKNIAEENNEDFNYVVIRYGLERMLYRLSKSEYKDRFVLKGATLFLHWQGEPHRPTKDADFAGTEKMSVEEMESIVEDLCELEVDPEDGVVFLTNTIEGMRIREGQVYEGIRVNLKAVLGNQKFRIQLDVGFGDALIPEPEEISYPVLLDFPAPELRAYQRETTISEKFQNMVEMGVGNSRMKDFYDIWFLSKNYEFDGSKLRQAIRETFRRRKTAIPEETPLALSEEFVKDDRSQANWTAFLSEINLTAEELSLEDVGEQICSFIIPITKSIKNEQVFNRNWNPGEGWI